MATLRALLKHGATQLRASPHPTLEAEVLLAFAMEVARSYLYAHPEDAVEGPSAERYGALIEARRAGHPVAYLVGHREFWSRSFLVNVATLIPRPETEALVERALEHIPPDTPRRVLDLGTGCGAVAVTLALERPKAFVVGTDISRAALAVASANANTHAARVAWVETDWLTGIDPGAKCDLLASNPPYIAEHDPHLSVGDLPFEPPSALLGGADGLAAIRVIANAARHHLAPSGCLVLEHGIDQGNDVRAIIRAAGLVDVRTYLDIEHRERVTVGKMG